MTIANYEDRIMAEDTLIHLTAIGYSIEKING